MGERIAVLCIDMQKEYFEEGRPLKVPSGQSVLEKVNSLLDESRRKNLLIIHVRHVSKKPDDSTFRDGSPYLDFVYDVPRAELVLTKNTPGAFHSTGLQDILKAHGITSVVICGLLSFMCCDTTAREAHARGYKVYFVKDATAAIDIGNLPAEKVHEATCAIQGWMFSNAVTTEEFISKLG
jgi:nicotinamidase-related amidase